MSGGAGASAIHVLIVLSFFGAMSGSPAMPLTLPRLYTLGLTHSLQFPAPSWGVTKVSGWGIHLSVGGVEMGEPHITVSCPVVERGMN